AEIFPPAASEPAEGRTDETRAHDLELPRDLTRQLLRLRPARGVLAPGDRDERRLDHAELALRRRPEAAQVPRLDARTLQLDERLEHREGVVAVVIRRDDERSRDGVLQQHHVGSGLADELLARQP